MKKFLLGVVFIIPIIVMIAITAATSIIAVATSPLPDEIVIYDDAGRLLQNGDTVELEITEEERYINIEVLPSLIQDDSIECLIDEESGNGRLQLIRADDTNKYYINPQNAGAVSVTIRANSNINLVRTLIFVINTQEITGISIHDEEGRELDSLPILKQTRLFAAIAPVVALDGYHLNWESSDPSVVTVSKNGMVYPVSRGKANVSVSALDKLGNTHRDSILIDATQALVTSDKVYSHNEITIQKLYEKTVLYAAASVSKLDDSHYIVSDGNHSVNLFVVTCGSAEWDFEDGIEVLYTRSAPYFAELNYLDIDNKNDIQDAQFTSDNPQVLSVDGSVLVPIRGGTATVTAMYQGVTKSKTFTIKENPAVLNMNLSLADAKLGIKLSRTWGLYWYDQDEQLVSTYQMSVDEHTDVVWSVDDETKATISPEGLITFKEACKGRKVTVTARTVVNHKLTGVSRSFTFNMHGQNAVNIDSFEELCRVNDMKSYVMILQNNIDSVSQVNLKNSLYGNGFTVSAEIRKCENTYDQSKIFSYNYHTDTDYYDTMETFVIEDIVLIGRDDPEKSTHCGIENHFMPNKTVFRYIVAKNFHTSIVATAAKDVLIEGCILGDNAHHSVSIMNNSETCTGDEKITMRNNIIKMSQGPAIVIIPQRFESVDFGKNIMPYFVIEGFLDIYNWKTASEIGPAFNVFEIENIDLGGFVDPEYLSDAINSGLTDLMASKSMEHLFYKDKNGDKYGSLGVFALGAMYQLEKSKLIVKDENLSLMPMPLSNVEGSAGMLIDIVNAITSANGMPINNTCYFVGYDFGNR
ncbi:MAG: hypothetical protein PHI19_06880, partial [Clostridia bacterium]|nr:hypothetical protein [Clostridia bacterium]